MDFECLCPLDTESMLDEQGTRLCIAEHSLAFPTSLGQVKGAELSTDVYGQGTILYLGTFAVKFQSELLLLSIDIGLRCFDMSCTSGFRTSTIGSLLWVIHQSKISAQC